MSRAIITEQHLSDIADAIRARQGSGSGSGAGFIVDDALNEQSTNPVQNNIIYTALLAKLGIAGSAGFHNSIYRGECLGEAVSAAQYAAIGAGTFDGMYVGDYWTINSRNYRIAAFDYWWNIGNTAENNCATHHVVLVPDGVLTTAKMNSTKTTAGGYVGSDYYAATNSNTGRATAASIVTSAFGANHILTHRELLCNAVADGAASARAWYDSAIELMSEAMVYGTSVHGKAAFEAGVSKGQLPLFRHDHSRITIRTNYWLRDVGSADKFAYVVFAGCVDATDANGSMGIRPAFAIMAA